MYESFCMCSVLGGFWHGLVDLGAAGFISGPEDEIYGSSRPKCTTHYAVIILTISSVWVDYSTQIIFINNFSSILYQWHRSYWSDAVDWEQYINHKPSWLASAMSTHLIHTNATGSAPFPAAPRSTNPCQNPPRNEQYNFTNSNWSYRFSWILVCTKLKSICACTVKS